MFSLLATTLILGRLVAPTTVELVPTDNVWVYPYAEDQIENRYLRAWGSDGKAVGTPGATNSSFSYSCLRFDVSKLPSDKSVTKATLALYHVAEMGFSLDDSKKSPLEVRPVVAAFGEKDWEFAMSDKVLPPADEKSVLGTGFPALHGGEKPVLVQIDLLKGPGSFKDALAKALKSDSKALGLALTSKLEPVSSGDGSIYKLYSRANEEKLRPKLTLVLE